MRVIIVEGPAGSGKSTRIAQEVDSHLSVESVSSSLEHYTGSRFPDDVEDTLLMALMNDVRKYHRALSILHRPYGELIETVYVDRLVYSQAIYGAIRLGQEPTRANVRRVLEHANDILITLTRYVNVSFQSTQDTPIVVAPEIHLEFIVPEWEQLVLQRHNGTEETGREYPAGRRDWEWYSVIAENLGGLE